MRTYIIEQDESDGRWYVNALDDGDFTGEVYGPYATENGARRVRDARRELDAAEREKS